MWEWSTCYWSTECGWCRYNPSPSLPPSLPSFRRSIHLLWWSSSNSRTSSWILCSHWISPFIQEENETRLSWYIVSPTPPLPPTVSPSGFPVEESRFILAEAFIEAVAAELNGDPMDNFDQVTSSSFSPTSIHLLILRFWVNWVSQWRLILLLNGRRRMNYSASSMQIERMLVVLLVREDYGRMEIDIFPLQ